MIGNELLICLFSKEKILFGIHKKNKKINNPVQPINNPVINTRVRYDYLDKIKSMFKLYTTVRTANLLEGNFRSTNLGKGMDFYDLKEYAYGDDIRDIDWKTSSHANKTLVRRYVTDRRHNVMFVLDKGRKMMGDTLSGAPKAELATMIFGTIAYLVERQSANVGMMYSNEKGYVRSPYRMGVDEIERLMNEYHKVCCDEPCLNLDTLLRKAAEESKKKHIIVVITDVAGMAGISESTFRRLTVNNDVLFAVMEDYYYTKKNTFDLDANNYGDPFITDSRRLHDIEAQHRKEMFLYLDRITKKYRIASTFINKEENLIKRSVELFQRYGRKDFGFGRGKYEDFG